MCQTTSSLCNNYHQAASVSACPVLDSSSIHSRPPFRGEVVRTGECCIPAGHVCKPQMSGQMVLRDQLIFVKAMMRTVVYPGHDMKKPRASGIACVIILASKMTQKAKVFATQALKPEFNTPCPCKYGRRELTQQDIL